MDILMVNQYFQNGCHQYDLKVSLENYKKRLKQQRCGVLHLNVPNLLHFHKNKFLREKMQKLIFLVAFVGKLHYFYSFLHFFHS